MGIPPLSPRLTFTFPSLSFPVSQCPAKGVGTSSQPSRVAAQRIPLFLPFSGLVLGHQPNLQGQPFLLDFSWVTLKSFGVSRPVAPHRAGPFRKLLPEELTLFSILFSFFLSLTEENCHILWAWVEHLKTSRVLAT